jgi:hypothetical protein
VNYEYRLFTWICINRKNLCGGAGNSNVHGSVRAVRAAVFDSVLRSVWQRAQQCATVWQCGISLWQCSSVRQCGSVWQCVWQCAAIVCGSVWHQCSLHITYTKSLTRHIGVCPRRTEQWECAPHSLHILQYELTQIDQYELLIRINAN